MIVRLGNLTHGEVRARLVVRLPFESAQMVDAMEENVREKLTVHGSVVTVPLPAKKIATVRLGICRTRGRNESDI